MDTNDSPTQSPPRGEPLHEPVMLAECLELLAPPLRGIAVDGTLGLGGHSAAILERVGPEGRLIGLDRDPAALARAESRLRDACHAWDWPTCPVTCVHSDFRHLGEVLDGPGVPAVDAVLLDLGVSSMQLDLPDRGFSFRSDGPLDMRMDPTGGETAADLVNGLPEAELARILWELGEERYSRRIARRIVEQRSRKPFTRTAELADAIRRAYPPGERSGRIHPATRSFQALRIEVNDELGAIEPALTAAVEHLSPGGRLAVITFHSLEDRIVKRAFEFLSGRCRCAPELPICACGAQRKVTILTRKPVEPKPEETARNPRSRSAKLRCVMRLEVG